VAKAERFGTQGHTFLSQRFDRTASGGRIHYASAMTMLGRNDGDGANNGASYLEIAEFLMRHGANANDDLEQLWRRIVFSIRVRNTDDHLRNHGFLLMPDGWRLAPAFDMNPEPLGRGLSLNIDEHDNALSMDLALSVAPLFRVDQEKATAIVAETEAKVSAHWRPLAKSHGLDRRQVDAAALAFEE
jgi:serine/threonine-protein kinase HipA